MGRKRSSASMELQLEHTGQCGGLQALHQMCCRELSSELCSRALGVRQPFNLCVLQKRVCSTMTSALLGLARQACNAVGKRHMASKAEEGFKVAVLGAAGGIGQPLSLLMKARQPQPEPQLNGLHAHVPCWL